MEIQGQREASIPIRCHSVHPTPSPAAFFIRAYLISNSSHITYVTITDLVLCGLPSPTCLNRTTSIFGHCASPALFADLRTQYPKRMEWTPRNFGPHSTTKLLPQTGPRRLRP